MLESQSLHCRRRIPLQKTQLLQILSVKLTVQYNEQTANLSLIIVKGNGQSLLGRDWLAQIRLDWQRIHSILNCGITEVLNRHSHVFQETLGTLQGYKAQLYVDPQARVVQYPIQCEQ